MKAEGRTIQGRWGNQQERETGLARRLKCPQLNSLLEKAPVGIVLHPTCLFSGLLQRAWFDFEVSTVVTLSQTLETFTGVLGLAWVHRGKVCYFQPVDWWTNTLGDGRAASLESSDGMGCSGSTGYALSAKDLGQFYVASQALACSKASKKRWAGRTRGSVSGSIYHCPGEPVKTQVWGIPTVDFHVAGLQWQGEIWFP